MELSSLRVSIVHDILDRYGGAEKVVEALLDAFPQADLYVSQDTNNPQTQNIRARFIQSSLRGAKQRSNLGLTDADAADETTEIASHSFAMTKGDENSSVITSNSEVISTNQRSPRRAAPRDDDVPLSGAGLTGETPFLHTSKYADRTVESNESYKYNVIAKDVGLKQSSNDDQNHYEQSEVISDTAGSMSPQLKTTFIQKLPLKRFLAKLYTPLLPYAFEALDLSSYDVVISSTAHFAKAVITSPNQVHICYCHTPPRFLYHYPTETNVRKHPILKHLVSLLDSKLRIFDFEAAQRPDVLVTNSKNTQKRIEKFYRRDAKVIYPPVEVETFNNSQEDTTEEIASPASGGLAMTESGNVIAKDVGLKQSSNDDQRHYEPSEVIPQSSDYFLFISRLLPYKNIDPIIDAFNELQDKLVIVGEGSERERLQEKAKPNIKFTGFVSDKELVTYMQNARAFIFNVRDEDFGIVMVEALAAGTPVIAYNGGGAREIVTNGVNGILYDDSSPRGIKQAIKRFLDIEKTLDKVKIQESAQKFSRERFINEIQELVKSTHYNTRP